jgi:hypothetical protein
MACSAKRTPNTSNKGKDQDNGRDYLTGSFVPNISPRGIKPSINLRGKNIKPNNDNKNTQGNSKVYTIGAAGSGSATISGINNVPRHFSTRRSDAYIAQNAKHARKN